MHVHSIPDKFNRVRHCHDPVADPNDHELGWCTPEHPCPMDPNSPLHKDPAFTNKHWAPEAANDAGKGTVTIEGELSLKFR